jgi:hypothetical protein
MKARTWSMAIRVTKFQTSVYKIPYPSGGSFAKSNIFLLHFLWALLVRKMMDGRKRGFTDEKMKEKQ